MATSVKIEIMLIIHAYHFLSLINCIRIQLKDDFIPRHDNSINISTIYPYPQIKLRHSNLEF
jgi:hypothetical protein